MTPSTTRPANAYVDCFSGISGDMFLGALLDAGLPLEVLTDTLAQIPLDGYKFTCQQTTRHSGIQATQVHVEVFGDPPVRDWRTIRELIAASRLPESVKSRAIDIFQVLATAEAKVHGCPLEHVHFHEVGAVDSIIDIIGAAIGLDYFRIKELTASPLPLANGWVQSMHGPLPLPAPAVCEILRGVPVFGENLNMELVTPTGAAIIKACAKDFGPLPAMTIAKVGYGAGSRSRPDGQANLLRLIIGAERTVTEAQQVTVIETNLDDWSPETFPYLSDRLFASGALDVSLTPVQMKKGRPGFSIQIIALPTQALALQQLLLTETSAIGLRYRQENRLTLPRRLGSILTHLGPIKAKRIETPTGTRVTPEYEDCRRIATETGLPISEVYRTVSSQPLNSFQPDPADGRIDESGPKTGPGR